MQLPKVSIVIPVYNGSNYLKNAIECALQQTYKNTEVLVINDGSTDGGETEAIALEYGDRIRYYRKDNGGVSSALNYGIQKMTGQYFSWLSHDDVYSPDKVEKSVALLAEHNALGKKVIAFTWGHHIDASGKKLQNFQKHFAAGVLYSGLDVLNIITQSGTLNGCCMLIPRSAFDEAGYFNESLRYSQDALMWYQIFLAGYGIVSDDLPNVMNRIHSNQVSQKSRNLFSHDTLVIAKLLAEPLANADSSGSLLKKYIKRLTRYECTEAVDYLYRYADRHGYLTSKDRLVIRGCRTLGFCRYHIVTAAKKFLIRFRS